MQQLDNRTMETIHLYVVRDEELRSSVLPVIFPIIALLLLIAVGVMFPYQQPEIHETLHVPAMLLPLRTFTTSVKVIATGIKTHQATTAHGILTITNGSILSEALPKGMIVTNKEGVEIVTDSSVFIPPGSATNLGYATVSASAVIPGASGNIGGLDINQVEGTALFIRNLQPFTGGQDAYTTTFITSTDRANARDTARTQLTAHISTGILLHPCSEAITGNQIMTLTWTCQFVAYHIPSYMKVTGIRVEGSYLLLDVVFVDRPERIETK